MMRFRAKLHLWTKNVIDMNIGFRCVFLLGCSRHHTVLGMLRDKRDVLRVIIGFMSLKTVSVVNILKHVVDVIESLQWVDYGEGLSRAWTLHNSCR